MANLLYMFIVIIFNVIAKYHRGHFWLNIDTAIILWVFHDYYLYFELRLILIYFTLTTVILLF